VYPNDLIQVRYYTNSIIRYEDFSAASRTTVQCPFCYQQCDVADSDIHKVRVYSREIKSFLSYCLQERCLRNPNNIERQQQPRFNGTVGQSSGVA
jgi:hypothetical protein